MAATDISNSISDAVSSFPGSSEEKEHLINNDESVESPQSPFPDLANGILNVSSSKTNFCKEHSAYSKSLPVASHGIVGSVSGPNQQYGSMTKEEEAKASAAPKEQRQSVIYCIHGNPGSCCAKLVNGTGSDTSIPIELTPPDQHCHPLEQQQRTTDKKARKKLIIASILCVIFMMVEVVGGVMSGSLAIATDAAHLLTDFAAFMISLFALWVSQRKPTRLLPFGWYRAEVIGALTSVLTIWVLTGILVYMAVLRVIEMDFEIDAMFMLVTSGFGVIVNLIMGATLHQHSHGSHSHHHEEAERAGHKKDEGRNINVRAAFIHVLGDFILSIGIFFAAIIIYFRPEWKIVDPICTFFFSVLVLITTFSIMKDTLIVLMEGIPRDVDFNDVLETFLSVDGVVAVHNLRIWALSLDKTALAAHVAVESNASPTEILKTASRKIHEKYNFFEMTLQIEHYQPRMQHCAQCQVPT